MARLALVLSILLPGALLLVPVWGCGGGGGGAPPPGGGPFINLSIFQPADTVIGQPDFTSDQPNQGGGPLAHTLNRPMGVGSGSLYIAEQFNHRVLGYLTPPLLSNAPADFVLGQPDFTSNAAGTTASTLRNPLYVRAFGGRLFVTDSQNHRVLIWNGLPTTTNVPASVVVGQPNFTTGTTGTTQDSFWQPQGLFVAAGRLFVADNLNNRVLVWNTIPVANGMPASLVLGQGDFVSGLPNRGGGPDADTLNRPGAIWSDGLRLFVLDGANHRILIWNALPTATGQPADAVIGQPNLTSNAQGTDATSFRFPTDLTSNGTQLFVADAVNNRVLIWNSLPATSGTPADVVLGQANFTNSASDDDDQDGVSDPTPSARTFDSGASWMFLEVVGNDLFVSDFWNNRVLVFRGI